MSTKPSLPVLPKALTTADMKRAEVDGEQALYYE